MTRIRDLNDVYDVPGMLTTVEFEYLYRLAKCNPGKGVIVEIGSRMGRSTIALARGTAAVDGEQVFAVDPHEPIPEEGYDEYSEKAFLANLKKAQVEDHVFPMVMTSEQAAAGWNRPIRMLWIDGDHQYDAVKLDYFLWERHLVDGGILAMHDTIRKRGPKRVLWEYIFRSDRFTQIAIVDNITAVQKVKRKSPISKLRDYAVLALRGVAWRLYRRTKNAHPLLKTRRPVATG